MVVDERGHAGGRGVLQADAAPTTLAMGSSSADIPELGMAVVDGHRGVGLGRLVLEELLERQPVMSLSVDLDNDLARRLYESLGFECVADEGTAATMVRRSTVA